MGIESNKMVIIEDGDRNPCILLKALDLSQVFSLGD
jgi:hypothetical protein